jgi:Cu-processing system permease protein
VDVSVVMLLARKEVRDALRNRWFLLYAAAFALMALGLSRLALDIGATAGFAGFGRTTASLVNLTLLVVPLLGLTLGASSIAGERERGTLATIMAQPVRSRELLTGKFLGLVLALTGAVGLGFGAAAAAVAVGHGSVGAVMYLEVVAFAVLLGTAMVAAGLLISAFAPSAGVANGVALFVWLCLVFFGDLGLMGTAVTLRLPASSLFFLAVVNPVESARVASVSVITGSLDLLGPAGAYALQTYGRGLPALLGAVLAAWAAAALVLAGWALPRRGYL